MQTQNTVVHRPRPSRAAFTLMELLVTISIIGLLAAILLPAINSAVKKAEITKAQIEVASLEGALKGYFQQYNRWPSFITSESGDGLPVSSQMVQVLRGENAGNSNPLKKRFMEFPEESLGSGLEFQDPWGRAYLFMVDLNFDNKIDINIKNQGGGSGLYKQVAVWSKGPDASEKSDDIGNWK